MWSASLPSSFGERAYDRLGRDLAVWIGKPLPIAV
jgi:hypothetical protein